jgi:hypothetical protein
MLATKNDIREVCITSPVHHGVTITLRNLKLLTDLADVNQG